MYKRDGNLLLLLRYALNVVEEPPRFAADEVYYDEYKT